MQEFLQQLINGIWQGAALALFAMGYTLVFGVLEIVNLAHGANYMWGAFIGFWLVTAAGWPLFLAIPAAMVGAGILAVLLDRLAFKPLRVLTAGGLVLWAGFLIFLLGVVGDWAGELRRALVWLGCGVLLIGFVLDYRTVRPLRVREVPHLAPMIASIGASIILINLAQGRFGAGASRFPADVFSNAPLALPAGLVIAPIQVLVLALSVALMLLLRLLLARTRMGRAIRAIAWSERTARLLGVNVDLVIAQTFFLSGALAGGAGVLLGLALYRLDPTMGNDIELAGLTVIIVGGMGSVGGAAVAAFLVGMGRVLSAAYLDSGLRDAFVFALLILVLVVRPSGLFGRDTGRRA